MKIHVTLIMQRAAFAGGFFYRLVSGVEMRSAILFLLVGVGLSVVEADSASRTDEEISYLISYLGASGCEFNRNGSWYSASRAVSHLNREYEYLRKRNLLPDTEAFIQHAASQSSSSGKPYLVKCGNKPETLSGAWFQEALSRFRAKSANAPRHR